MENKRKIVNIIIIIFVVILIGVNFFIWFQIKKDSPGKNKNKEISTIKNYSNKSDIKNDLYKYIEKGPFDETKSCFDQENCIVMFAKEDRQNKDFSINMSNIFAEKNTFLKNEIFKLIEKNSKEAITIKDRLIEKNGDLKLNSESEISYYFQIISDQSFIDNIKNEDVDQIAKEVLTKESYEVEKMFGFYNFRKFIKDFLEIYIHQIQSEINRYEEWRTIKPLEGEREFLMENNKMEILDNGLMEVSLYDLNDESNMETSGYYAIDFDLETGEVILVEPRLIFNQMIVINKNRMASVFQVGQSFIAFDLVRVENSWKFDTLEPFRPDKNKNPRIVYFNLQEEDLKNRWQKIEEKINIKN